MLRRVRAAVLLAAMLVASLAPTVSASLHAGDEGMACCAAEDHCDSPAINRACCPCGPATPSDPPASARVVHATPQPTAAAPWTMLAPLHHGALGPHAVRAFARLLAQAAPDPPWLLHAAILV